MTGLKLIREQIENFETLMEERGDAKLLHIKGPFLAFETKNRNNRFYPAYCNREVERYITEKVSLSNAYGELGHPTGPIINPERISHLITELKQDGKNWIGDAIVIDKGYGEIVHAINKIGGKLGVSSRALGSLKESNGMMVVQEDFKLSTAADIVTDPSAPNAYVNGIMENVSWTYDESFGWRQQELVETHKKALRKMKMDEIERAKLPLIESFLRSLRS